LRDSGGGNPAAAYARALRAARGKNPSIERYARLGLVEMRWAAHIQTDEARSHGELDSIIQAFEHPRMSVDWPKHGGSAPTSTPPPVLRNTP
jgi:hypothetical protein